MEDRKFDALTRAFGRGTSRRTAIKGLFGGVVGGVAVVTRLDRAGAQPNCDPNADTIVCPPGSFHAGLTKKPDGGCCNGNGNCCSNNCVEGFCVAGSVPECTPETVLIDCPLPNACTMATCPSGTCLYEDACNACNPCDNATGQCVPILCDPGEECVGGSCQPICGETELFCSDGSCAPQCCTVDDCIVPGATFCSSVICNADGYCEVIPECTEGQICCGQGEEGAFCAECCSDDDCLGCATCNQAGQCSDPECCTDTDCDDCNVCGQDQTCHPIVCLVGETCCEGHECIPEDECCKGVGDFCGLLEVASAWDGSPQFDCCDGLVCCENWNSQGSVCAECCNDWDCPKGAFCNEGWCEFPHECKSDWECPKDTCCCKDGTCSGKCCQHKPHPKPPKPAPPAPAAPVTTLPATGAGDTQQTTGLYGAAALGAAAAYLAARKLRQNPEAPAEE